MVRPVMAKDDAADESKDEAVTEQGENESDADDAREDADEAQDDAAGDEAADGDDDAHDEPEAASPPPAKAAPAKKAAVPARMEAARPKNVAEAAAPPPAASLGKSVSVFMFVLLALSAGFWVLGAFDNPFGTAAPKWKIGQQVSVDLTLDPADDTKLACASSVDVGGKRCEYESKTARFSGKLEDTTQLRPYTTVDGVHLLAAGVWSSPDIAKEKRPRDRFTLRCDYKVETKVASPAVRWDIAGQWNEKDEEWYAGLATNCKLQK